MHDELIKFALNFLNCGYMSLKMLAPSFRNRFLRASENLGKGTDLLNVGCGDGEYNRKLSGSFTVTHGIDINEDEIRYASSIPGNSRFMVGSACEMPIRSGMFSSVCCIDVIEHIDDDMPVIREISRVMKKGGKLVISVPNRNFPFTYDPVNAFLRMFGKKLGVGIWGFGHRRLYDADGLSRALKENGLEVEEVQYLNSYFSGLVENYVSNVLYRFLKPKKGVRKEGREPPRALQRLTDVILDIDKRLFADSKVSIGIMIRARKVG